MDGCAGCFIRLILFIIGFTLMMIFGGIFWIAVLVGVGLVILGAIFKLIISIFL
jgi:hypothetical protein